MKSKNAPADPTDPELEALPEPRRPWRRATLVAMGVTIVASLTLGFQLRDQIAYALTDGQPVTISDLARFEPKASDAGAWVHARGTLVGAVSGYRRPLDPDRFRIAPVEGNPGIWVELREPSGSLGEHFVPPVSFIGRLISLRAPDLQHQGLIDALKRSGQPAPEPDAWLLIDGESPASSRWVLGVTALLAIFAGFSSWGIYRLIKPYSAGPVAHSAAE
jgi:hypothetical protein